METISCDILVAGGGMAGLTVARELSHRGVRVALTDSGRFGAGASSAAAGMLAPLVEAHAEERDLLRFGYECLRGYPAFVASLLRETGIDADYRVDGTLYVAVDRDQSELLRHQFEEQRSFDLPVQWLTGYQCRQREPMLAPRIVAGIMSPRDHQLDNRLLLKALVASCRHYDVTMIEEAGAGTITIHGGGMFGYTTESCRVESAGIVLATGARTELASSVLPDIARLIRPVKGQIVRLDQSAMPLLSTIIRSPEMYLAPKSDGRIVLGASSEDRGFDESITAGEIYELLRAAWECVPGIHELPIAEMRAGFRPATVDHKPLLGGTSVPGIWVAMGYYRHGILFGPRAAELLADGIIDGTRSEWLEAFSPERMDIMAAHKQHLP